jgi:hypothetical protein
MGAITIRLLPHAQEAMARREIPAAWVELALSHPDWSDDDPARPGRRRAFKAMPDCGGRILRVVYWRDGSDSVVLTVHLDRDALKARRR